MLFRFFLAFLAFVVGGCNLSAPPAQKGGGDTAADNGGENGGGNASRPSDAAIVEASGFAGASFLDKNGWHCVSRRVDRDGDGRQGAFGEGFTAAPDSWEHVAIGYFPYTAASGEVASCGQFTVGESPRWFLGNFNAENELLDWGDPSSIAQSSYTYEVQECGDLKLNFCAVLTSTGWETSDCSGTYQPPVCEDGGGNGSDTGGDGGNSDVDRDGDGYDDGADCDDGDDDVYPGAAESCDGDDNDCDGAVDEGCGGGAESTYYRDADGDGYGNAASTASSSDGAPEGYVANDDDCDDRDADIHPGASEIPDNGIDEDCSGADDSGGSALRREACLRSVGVSSFDIGALGLWSGDYTNWLTGSTTFYVASPIITETTARCWAFTLSSAGETWKFNGDANGEGLWGDLLVGSCTGVDWATIVKNDGAKCSQFDMVVDDVVDGAVSAGYESTTLCGDSYDLCWTDS